MRRPFVAGNWKMNGGLDGARALARALAADLVDGAAEVAVCPPFVHIEAVAAELAGSPIVLGAQDVCDREPGAVTGAVAAEMLADLGCRTVLVGHSERRSLYGESDGLVAAKHERAAGAGLQPVLCVGETLEEREAGRTEAVIARQIDAVAERRGAAAVCAGVVAYEPVWAIGTGRTASPEQAQAVHAFIRARLARDSREGAAAVRILYGGSVKSANAAELFAMPDIDGGLIGGASLDAQEFIKICRLAD